MAETATDVGSFFQLQELTPERYEEFADAAYSTGRAREKFDAALREHQAAGGNPLYVGLAQLILGRFQDAVATLNQAPAGSLRDYYLAQSHRGLQQHDEALNSLAQAAKGGWDSFAIDVERGEVLVQKGDLDAARQIRDQHARDGQDRAGWYYLSGLILEAEDQREAALESFDKALSLQPDHVGAGFRAAILYDRFGDDQSTIDLYERLARKPRAHVNALMNLAVVYEDHGRFEKAAQCLRRVLKLFPNHARARLYLKDVESSREMVIEDTLGDRDDGRNKLLDMPIQDFELSVRARNCLKKMKIDTLGQLLRLSEVELLAYKNFGETSLNEIKNLLSRKGLRLGQRPDEIDPDQVIEAPPPKVAVPPGSEAMLGKPVSELELSVRARRCLQRLNIVTVGDLIQHTEQDLLSTRNFGVTSLNEIKGRLDELGLQLAPKA